MRLVESSSYRGWRENLKRGSGKAILIHEDSGMVANVDINLSRGKASLDLTPGGTYLPFANATFSFDRKFDLQEVLDRIVLSLDRPVAECSFEIVDTKNPFVLLSSGKVEDLRDNLLGQIRRNLSKIFDKVEIQSY